MGRQVGWASFLPLALAGFLVIIRGGAYFYLGAIIQAVGSAGNNQASVSTTTKKKTVRVERASQKGFWSGASPENGPPGWLGIIPSPRPCRISGPRPRLSLP